MRFDNSFLKRVKPFLFLVWDSLTPTRYPYLSGRLVRNSYSYLITLVFVCFIISGFFFIPKLISLQATLNNEFSKFNQLEIEPKIETREPVRFDYARILVDTQQDITELDDYNLIISQHHVLFKPLPCLLFKPFCWFNFNKDLSLSSNLKESKKTVLGIINLLVLASLPAIMFFFFFSYLIKYLALTLFFAAIAFFILRIMLYQADFVKLLNMAIYSSTIMVITEVLNIPFKANLYYLPFILFFAYFITGIVLVTEKKRIEKEVR